MQPAPAGAEEPTCPRLLGLGCLQVRPGLASGPWLMLNLSSKKSCRRRKCALLSNPALPVALRLGAAKAPHARGAEEKRRALSLSRARPTCNIRSCLLPQPLFNLGPAPMAGRKAPKATRKGWADLGDDALQHVCSFLDGGSLAELQLVDRRSHAVASRDEVWRCARACMTRRRM